MSSLAGLEKSYVMQQRCGFPKPGQDKECGQLWYVKTREQLLVSMNAGDVHKWLHPGISVKNTKSNRHLWADLEEHAPACETQPSF